MSRRILPLLYLNLGGEMLYVLDQRLSAQKVAGDKSSKVLDDIASTMFNKKFLEEIFLHHTPLHSKRMLRAMFDKLAHSSIMRLNTNSMDKLYDLMVMTVKYQILMTRNPHNVIMVTLNHLDAIMDYASSDAVKKNVQLAYELLLQSYCPLSTSEMQTIRYAMLNFLQDLRVRVSIFLQDGLQHVDGSFKFDPNTKLMRGVEEPGRIRFFDDRGEIMTEVKFHPGAQFSPPDPSGGLGPHEIGNRGTKYGLNMYANSKFARNTLEDTEEQVKGTKYLAAASVPDSAIAPCSSKEISNQHLAKDELNLLAKLIGNDRKQSLAGAETFKLNLFDLDSRSNAKESRGDKPASSPSDTTDYIHFDLKTQAREKSREMTEIIGQMQNTDLNNEGTEDDDLLSLMDKT